MNYTPKDVDDATYAFPAKVVGTLLPPNEEIPDGIRYSTWHDLAEEWFFSGCAEDTVFTCRDGIDPKKALRHLSACLRSFQPKHQHKTAGVALLMSHFFEKVEMPSRKKTWSAEPLKADQ